MRAAKQCLVLLSAVVIAASAGATDQGIPAKVGVVKPAKLAKLVATNPLGYTPTAGSSDDPTLHGAELRVFDTTAPGAGSVKFSLDKTGWVALGSPPGAAGYKYSGRSATPVDNTCASVLIKPTIIKAVCKGAGVTVAPPFDGDAGVILGLPTVAAATTRYCAQLGGTLKKNTAALFKHINADAPSVCPTSVAFHTCTLGPTSQMVLHVSSLPVPLSFMASGSIEIGSDIGGTDTDCRLQNLNPIVIPSIGALCFSPINGCPLGTRYCGPGGPGTGPPLGVDFSSDDDIGTCASNTVCQAACAAACGAGKTAIGNCTGFCTGTSPADQACTTDAACMPTNGSCQGPEPVAGFANKCQCSCINTAAHGASDQGDGQCSLGLSGVLEATAPCDGTDVNIQFGSGCLPVSNQRASAHVIDANFMPGAVLPVSPNTNDQLGVSLACSTFDAGTLTGLVGVGAGNYFGSTLGDVSIGLKAACQ